MQQTQNYNMNRPEVNDTFSLNDWNQNINTLDEVLAPEFEDYEPNEEGSTTIPDTTTALAGIKSKTKIADLFKNIKAFCKGCCTLGMLVDNCVTNNSNLPLAASQGKALMDLYTQLNSNLSKKKIEFTFADGVTHQAGDSYVIGKVAYISECINIAKDIPMGTKIITSLKIAGQAINCCFTYGNIIQSFNYIGCRCIVVESSITTESVIEIENGNYPSIIATCVLNV